MKSVFAWSVRREIWEHRSVWIWPLAVAGLVVVAAMLGIGHLPSLDMFLAMPVAKQQVIVSTPFGLASAVILFTSFAVGVFYCLDALFAERRDRSILFWKSMPVSDATTVLSKAFVPFAVIPVIGVAIALITQVVLFVASSAVMSVRGLDLALVYDRLPIFPMTASVFYGVAVHCLWYAPVHALLLLVSAATRRPIVWAIVPPIVVQMLEKIAFGTSYTNEFIGYRLLGAMTVAFKPNPTNAPITSLSQLDPVRFLSTPGLWLGLLAAVALLYVTIRLRRSRETLS